MANSFLRSDAFRHDQRVEGCWLALARCVLLALGLSFFWPLMRHAVISGVMVLAGMEFAGAKGVLGYYMLLAVFCGTVSYLVGNVDHSRGTWFARLCLGCGLLAGALLVPGALGTALPAPLGFLVVGIMGLATSLLVVQCVLLAFAVACVDSRRLLLCVFGSTLLNIVHTFVLSDVLALGDGVSALYPILASVCLYMASRCDEGACVVSGDVKTAGFLWNRGRIGALVGVLVLSTLLKALAGAALLGEELRLVKHLVGILELSLILMVASASKKTAIPLSVAFYLLLGGFALGATLASLPASDGVVQMGIAAITTARVLAEAMALVLAADLVGRPERGGVFTGVFLCFFLPETVACALGYGVLPLLSGPAAQSLVDSFRCASTLCVGAFAIGALSVLSSRELRSLKGSPQEEEGLQKSASEKLPKTELLVKRLGLTEREAMVAQCIYSGYSVKRISSQEGISINTVQSHARNLYRKLGVHSRQELVDAVDEAREAARGET